MRLGKCYDAGKSTTGNGQLRAIGILPPPHPLLPAALSPLTLLPRLNWRKRHPLHLELVGKVGVMRNGADG